MNITWFCRCLESGDWAPVLGCHTVPKQNEGCKEITFLYKGDLRDITYMHSFGAFLGIWKQVKNTFIILNTPTIMQTGELVNGKPVYVRQGNDNLHLSYSNKSGSLTPWRMRAGKLAIGTHKVASIKFGPQKLVCPENSLVWSNVFVVLHFKFFINRKHGFTSLENGK